MFQHLLPRGYPHRLIEAISKKAMGMLPFVSIVVPLLNAEKDVCGLLDCLSRQTYPPDRAECLVVDNGSRDRTKSLLEAGTARATSIPVRLLEETGTKSSYAARNAGIAAGQGEIVAFTDADCRPQPSWLANLVNAFDDSSVGLVAGEVGSLPGATLVERYSTRRQMLSQKHTLRHPFRPYAQTANLAIRRQVLEQIGLFRPFMTSGGDADICWRAYDAGWRLDFAWDAVVLHRHRTTIRGLWKQCRRYGRGERYLNNLYGVVLPAWSTRQHIHGWINLAARLPAKVLTSQWRRNLLRIE